jgi:hypothetical protein
MTLLEKALSKEGLARIDTFRQRRGIRTRRQALETLLKETIPMKNEHPLTTKLRLAKENPTNEAAPEHIQEAILERRAGKGEYVGLDVILKDLQARQRGN